MCVQWHACPHHAHIMSHMADCELTCTPIYTCIQPPTKIRFPLHTRRARPQQRTNRGCSSRNAQRSSRWRPLRRCNTCVCVAVCVACSVPAVMLVGMRCLLTVVAVNRFTPRYPRAHMCMLARFPLALPLTVHLHWHPAPPPRLDPPDDAIQHEHCFVRNAPAQYLHTHIHSNG